MDKKDKILIMLCLCIGAFMNLLDTTIINVSIPHIAGTFGTAVFNGTWIITSYAVSEAICLPLIGWSSKRIGTKKQYLISVLMFTMFSAFCGMSPSFTLLLFFRVCQGVVGASMIPLSQALIVELYPIEKRAFPLGLWSMTMVFAPIVGPILGGKLSDTIGWRWCFFINVPFGLLSTFVAYMVYKKIGLTEKKEKLPIDKIGIMLLVIGVGSLQIMLDKGRQYNWFQNNIIITLSIIAFIFLTILLIWEWYHPTPIINIRLFKNKNFLIGSLNLFFTIGVIYAMIIIIPLWLQDFLGYTAYQSGLTLFLQALPVLILAPTIGKLGYKLDLRKVIILALIIMGSVGLFITQYSTSASQGYIAISRLFFGIGIGFFFAPVNIVALKEIKQEDMPAASGLFNFIRNMGISFGTALSLDFWDNRVTLHRTYLVSSIKSSNPNFFSYLENLSGNLHEKLLKINDVVELQAGTMGVNDVMTYTAILLLLMIPFMFLLKSTKS
ncbi:DHA2 family efflux MFS transporter permease subunit [Cetobacterium somerae]|uniref:DHA2 family efflux MFS transporter permease subunit n=1 Tax=Cetobacterium somerae TaxID=188913 RepID=UPI00248DFABF|nr:DHA2 family efflux MFS transporter permease subunit [Cetobacterium somerae]